MSLRDKMIGLMILCVVCFTGGMALQEYMSSDNMNIVKASVAKPEVRHDASHVTAARTGVVRAEDQQVSLPAPRKATVLHTAKLTLGGLRDRSNGVTGEYKAEATAAPCPPIDLDVTLYREKDGGSRMDFSSPNGEVVAASHTPSIESIAPARKKNGVGLAGIYDGVETKPGLLLKREILLVDVNALVAQDFVSVGAVYRF